MWKSEYLPTTTEHFQNGDPTWDPLDMWQSNLKKFSYPMRIIYHEKYGHCIKQYEHSLMGKMRKLCSLCHIFLGNGDAADTQKFPLPWMINYQI